MAQISGQDSGPLIIDPSVFDSEDLDPEVTDLNRLIVEKLSALGDPWMTPLPERRKARAEGKGPFPVPEPDPHARTVIMDDGSLQVPLRVFEPLSRESRGAYLHIHGGGWVLGTPQENDPRLRRLCEATGLTVVSVDYRLAPEHRYPAGPDDCEAVAAGLIQPDSVNWLAPGKNRSNEHGCSDTRPAPQFTPGFLNAGRQGDKAPFLAIGGESAGAHLAVVTLLRLRDKHGVTPFRAALLTAGCFDLGLTPSVRQWGDERLILNTKDVELFVEHFLPNEADRRNPDISPLYGCLTNLPPALFTCGTKDLLLDDTLMLAPRWLSAGNRVELRLHRGGCHVFQAFSGEQADLSLAEMEVFLNGLLAERVEPGPAQQPSI